MTKKIIKEKLAFTLAEVLITLGIIGIVSAMTIPTLVANYQQKSMDTQANTFNRKLGEALKIMNTQSELAGHGTTQAFVSELSKHIKILKVCEKTKLKVLTTDSSGKQYAFKTKYSVGSIIKNLSN